MVIHIVEEGDTLNSIALRYGVSTARLMTDNGLTTSSLLVVGQALIVTLPSMMHTVAPGETIFSIAAAYGTTEMVLLQNNPTLIFSPTLYPGQDLVIAFRGGKRRTIEVAGYAYPHINQAMLEYALPYLTYLSIFSYGFKENGELIPADDEELIRLADRYQAAPILVLTTITEDSGFSTEKAQVLLYDTAYQQQVLENLIAVMLEKGYVGLDIDFEFIAAEDSAAYLTFLQTAKDMLSVHGLLLSVALAPKTYAEQPGLLYEAHDYAAIGKIADMVLLMTYEWGYAYGPPMAVAPLDQVRRVVEYAVTEIPVQKIQMGVPNYGYDWRIPFVEGVSRAISIGNEQAVQLAATHNSRIEFDEVAASPFFHYRVNASEHVVWFEDVRSINAKLLLTDEDQLLGIGYWNIMRPFAQNWALLATSYGIQKLV